MANTYPTIHRLDGGVTSETSLGRVNSTLMDTIFAHAPLLKLTEASYREEAMTMLLGPDYTRNAHGAATTSWDYPTYVRKYSTGEDASTGAPTITTDAAPSSTTDSPGTMYYPNSAYPSNSEADDPRVGESAIAQNAYPFAVGAGGDGSTTDPQASSAVNDTRNAATTTIGQYIMGQNQ